MILMRKNVTLSMDEEIHKRGKRVAGLIPFSRWVEHLIMKEIYNDEEKPEPESIIMNAQGRTQPLPCPDSFNEEQNPLHSHLEDSGP